MWHLIKVSKKSLNLDSINKPRKPMAKTIFFFKINMVKLGAEMSFD